MDTISHSVWAILAFGRKNKRLFIYAALFGALPDIIPFGYSFLARFSEYSQAGPPTIDAIPSYIFTLYNVTHSLVIAGVICGFCYFKWGKKALPLLGWPLHVLFDIPSHSISFFPTPYLWPFQTPFFDGIPWVTPWVFYLNWGTLIVLLIAWYLVRERKV